MGVRVLESVNVPTTTRPRLWLDDSNGYPIILTSDKGCVAAADQDAYARAARFALAAGPLRGKTAAWLGGGLCIGPRLFALMGAKQTVYEIEPALAEFCLQGVTFVPGDWKGTLTGAYDVIVYDLGGEVPRETLATHLNPGGVILP